RKRRLLRALGPTSNSSFGGALRPCPNGAASSSPGLPRAAGLPWVGAPMDEQPQRGCGIGRFAWLNPVGVERSVAIIPKVAAARQPWALGLSPVGAAKARLLARTTMAGDCSLLIFFNLHPGDWV